MLIAVFFLIQTKSHIKNVPEFKNFGRKKKVPVKKAEKPLKVPVKIVFIFENLREFTPVKTKKVRVKMIKNSGHEKTKYARENCRSFFFFSYVIVFLRHAPS